MKKNATKIILDIIMTLLLVMLYNSHIFNVSFHEIAGLFIILLFIIHCVFNKKWIAAVSKKILTKTLPTKTKISYIIVFLLVVGFVLIIVSGILCSQVLFPAPNAHESPWRIVHIFTSAITLILVGIHLGLHWGFVKNMLKRVISIPQRAKKALSLLVVITVLLFGSYSIMTSSFIMWLQMPFSAQDIKAEKNASKEMSSDSAAFKEKDEHSTNGERPNESKIGSKDDGNNLGIILNTITTYLSILGLVTIITYYLDKLILMRNKKRTL